MIGKEGKGFLAAHWDWLLAGLGAAFLAAGAAWFVMESGEDASAAAAEETRSLNAVPNAAKPVEPVDMSIYGVAMKTLETPMSVVVPSETLGSYFASDRRVFCEQKDPKTGKQCAMAIPFGTKTCPFCGEKQPEATKPPALDTDGDGISDEAEVALGLNPEDKNDAEGDLDGDGFTNLEEYAAKTDLRDPASHPDYIDFIRIEGKPKSTHLTFRFVRAKKTPSGIKFEFLFPKEKNDWGKLGKTYSVPKDGEIGKTGFFARDYEEKIVRVSLDRPGDKVKTTGKTEVDKSVAVVERKSDGRTVRLNIGDKELAAVDVTVTLVCDRDAGRRVEVVKGAEFEIRGEKFQAVDVIRQGDSAKVQLKNLATGSTKTISALE